MVTREFRCTAHDYEFEVQMEMDSRDVPECPYGCSPKYVVLEFRTPHSIRSNGTSSQDILMSQLARDYGMSDMRNTDGQSVMASTPVGSGGIKRTYSPEKQAKWAPNIFTPERGWAARAADPKTGYVDPGSVPKFEHSMPGQRTGLKNIIDSRPPETMRSKTVFQKPK